MKRHATLSRCGRYRYWLERSWAETGKGFVNFIMLNPSTADAERDDPTIRKCIGFARRWGYDGVHVVNLFALRATDPAALRSDPSPIGPENDTFLEAGVLSAERTICAWGNNAAIGDRAAHVLRRLAQLEFGRAADLLYALRINRDGSPAHPLYVPYAVEPVSFPGAPA